MLQIKKGWLALENEEVKTGPSQSRPRVWEIQATVQTYSTLETKKKKNPCFDPSKSGNSLGSRSFNIIEMPPHCRHPEFCLLFFSQIQPQQETTWFLEQMCVVWRTDYVVLVPFYCLFLQFWKKNLKMPLSDILVGLLSCNKAALDARLCSHFTNVHFTTCSKHCPIP